MKRQDSAPVTGAPVGPRTHRRCCFWAQELRQGRGGRTLPGFALSRYSRSSSLTLHAWGQNHASLHQTERSNLERILVTGAAGYLGSWVTRRLLDAGLAVRGLDSLDFGAKGLDPLRSHPQLELIGGNLRDLEDHPAWLTGVDRIVHLAGLANDPCCDLDPELTEVVNFDSTLALARAGLERGIQRFVFASSCSVYGAGSSRALREDSPLRPVSLYAQAKARAEEALLELGDQGLEPVLLRQATLFGCSPRMRFDLAINLMTYHAVKQKRIYVLGGGQQWRPFLHVQDAAEAFHRVLVAEADQVSGEIFNVGSTRENYRIADLANLVAAEVPGTVVEQAPEDADKRSYNVSFEKLQRALEWEPRRTAREGAQEIRDAFAAGAFADAEDASYYNVRTQQTRQQLPVSRGGDPLRTRFLPFALPDFGQEEEREVVEVLRSGWVTTGPRTQRFEELLQEFTGAQSVVAVSSCTAALHLALLALELQPEDEVITTPITWPSTANVIVHCGARPVFADVDPTTLNLDPATVAAKITPRTRAIIPVHLAGRPVDLPAFRKLADAHGLELIEDAAHALGANLEGRPIGSHSRFTCFSFYPIKNMSTGEGGAIALNDPNDEELVRLQALHGITRDAWKRYGKNASLHWECVAPGFKYNMPDLAAALGIHQIAKLPRFLERRRKLAELYHQELRDVEELVLPEWPFVPGHAHHLYIVQLRSELLEVDRDQFLTELRHENIGTGIHFRGLFLQPYYRDTWQLRSEDFPHAAAASDRMFSLPLYPKMTEHDVVLVARTLRKLLEYYRR